MIGGTMSHPSDGCPAVRDSSHCRECHRTWGGKAEVHCPTCHAHFSKYSTFDMHLRVAKRGEVVECRDPATVRKRDGSPVLRPVDGAGGVTWAWPRERPEYWRAAS